MMGHLKSFSASGGANLNKNFPKIQMPGGLPGGGCLSFNLTGTLSLHWGKLNKLNTCNFHHFDYPAVISSPTL